MNPKPHILYWKWNNDLLDRETMRSRTLDIVNRCTFNVIYISLHAASLENQIATSPVMRERIRECAEILKEYGRKLVLDMDIRREMLYMAEHPIHEKTYLTKYCRGHLDEHGSYTEQTDGGQGVFFCKSLMFDENGLFDEATVCDITDKVSVFEGIVNVQAGDQYRNRDIVFYVYKQVGFEVAGEEKTVYDILGDEYKGKWDEACCLLKDIGVSGIATDEWKVPARLETPSGKDGSWASISEMASDGATDMNKVPFFIHWFTVSDGLCRYYQEKFGSDLKEDLLYFRNDSADREKGIRIVNQYLEILRQRTADGDQFLYDMSKKYFGEDSIVLCHPTWWGDELDSILDVPVNGLDWWEVKRDFAQTDELILMPIRMARSRRCPENLWYNMWYSMRTLDIETYYRESWVNARYGGRTHYLGYECYEPGVVLCLNQKDYLEKCSEMEERIALLDEVQTTRPDARILLVFGYEATCNWKICDPGKTRWERVSQNIHNVWKFSKELFDSNYLCDLIPSTEIDNGYVDLAGDKIRYCGHEYDMLICIMPEGMSEKASAMIRAYSAVNTNLIIVGNTAEFLKGCGVLNTSEVELEPVLAVLKDRQIRPNCGENYCIYEDGSILFTTDGEKHVGNALKIDDTINGLHIKFEGEDFLHIKPKNGGYSVVCGKSSQIKIG